MRMNKDTQHAKAQQTTAKLHHTVEQSYLTMSSNARRFSTAAASHATEKPNCALAKWGGAEAFHSREHVREGLFAKGEGGENVSEGTFAREHSRGELLRGNVREGNIRERTFAKGDGGREHL